MELVYIEDHHTAIIPREVFERAQRLIGERGGHGRGNGARFALSGKVRCGKCGLGYTSKFKETKSGGYRLWRCSGRCGNRSVRDSILREKIAEELDRAERDRVAVVRTVRKVLEKQGADIPQADLSSLLSAPLSDAIVRRIAKKVTVTDGEIRVELTDI